MCGVLPALLAASTAMQVVGGQQQAGAQAAAAQQQAEVAERNAEIVRQDKKTAGQVSQIQARRRTSLASARLSNSGVDTSSGSAFAVLEQMRRDEEFNQATEAREFDKAEIGAIDTAEANRAAASNFRSAGRINAVGSLLGGGVQAYSFANQGFFDTQEPAPAATPTRTQPRNIIASRGSTA